MITFVMYVNYLFLNIFIITINQWSMNMFKLPYEIPNPVPAQEVVIKHDSFKAFFKNRLLAKKRRFEYQCIDCSSISITTRGNQMKRKYPWLCESCATSADWATYTKEERQERLKKSTEYGRTDEAREFRSKKAKAQWEDPDSWFNTSFVPPMSNLESRKKIGQTVKQKLINDEKFRSEFLERMKNASRGTLIKFKEPNGKSITLRSTYELRVATWLNENHYDWKYESKSFYIEELEKTYTPDFYLTDLNVWIEVKGIWQSETSELKWEFFSKNYNTVILFKQDIIDLENGKSLEDKINYIQ